LRVKEGEKVVFSNPNYGREHDQVRAKKYLKAGGTYTIESVSVHSSSSDVVLQEFPGIELNSVLFENA
jgi:hypothetical protein